MSKSFTIRFVPYETQRTEQINQPIGILKNIYDQNPPWHTVQTNLTMARNVGVQQGVFNFVDLTALNTWHVENANIIVT